MTLGHPKECRKMDGVDSGEIFFPCKETLTATTNEWLLIGSCCEIDIIESTTKTKTCQT